MPPSLRIAYFAHTLRSDWNNGNAHFLRGLMRSLLAVGHDVTVYEPEIEWSIEQLRTEARGAESLQQFDETYADIGIQTYAPGDAEELWRERLRDMRIVILHEWNPPTLAALLLRLRDELGYRLLFHDTHHRASSSPEQIERFHLREFDGILVFGESLRTVYRENFNVRNVWVLHEAADTTIFHPRPEIAREREIVWVGNWGDGERSHEIRSFLLAPAARLRDVARTAIYGVRYPEEGLRSLREAGVQYGGYLPNLGSPEVYARAAATVHVPRQQYSQSMRGIPTIRVFEALACGIPLISAPWEDSEALFRKGDFLWAQSTEEMEAHLRDLLLDPAAAQAQAERGLQTVRSRHTCHHRAEELTAICEELLR